MMTDQIVRYHVRSRQFWVIGVMLALMSLLFGAVILWRVWDWVFNSGWNGVQTADVLILTGFAGVCALTLFALGMAVRKPVGLRIDQHGISGYFAPNLKWSEIDGFEPRTIHNGSGIFVILKDPEARAKQRSKSRQVLNFLDVFPKSSFINTTQLSVAPQDVIAEMEQMRLAAALER